MILRKAHLHIIVMLGHLDSSGVSCRVAEVAEGGRYLPWIIVSMDCTLCNSLDLKNSAVVSWVITP